MEMDFYKSTLEKFGLEVVIPDKQETRNYIQNTLKNELGAGILKPETKAEYLSIIQDLNSRGAEGVILGCTEIPLLIKQTDLTLPVFDTTQIHSEAIVKFII
jgi:aspartate racemase